MIRTFLLGTVAGCVTAALIIHMLYIPLRKQHTQSVPSQGSTMKPLRIATLSMLNSSFAHRLLSQFKTVLAEKHMTLSATVTSYFADNRLDMTAVANEMIDKNYDLIYTVEQPQVKPLKLLLISVKIKLLSCFLVWLTLLALSLSPVNRTPVGI